VQFDRSTGNPFTLSASGTPARVVDSSARPFNPAFSLDINPDDIQDVGKIVATTQYDYTDNVWVTPLTPAQVNFLWHGEGVSLALQLLRPFIRYATNERKEQVLRRIVERMECPELHRFGSSRAGLPLTTEWHRKRFRLTQYGVYARAFAALAEYVRQAIHDDDVTDLQEHIIDNCEHIADEDRLGRLTDALQVHGLDLDLTRCDCGHIERIGDTHEVGRNGNATWCHTCFEDDAVWCEDREEYWPRDDCYEHDDGSWYSYEQDRDDDDDDDNDETPDNLMSYSTNVLNHIEPDRNIKSSSTGDFLMGIEFEMITKGRVSEAVDDVREELGTEYCVCKSDGSLSAGGLEIVTAPRGLAEHIERFKKWTVHSLYRAWDERCCGMHIHIDSRAFTEMTLGKFIMLINAEGNTDFIRKIAGRHANRDSQAQSYCQVEGQASLVNPKQAIKGKSSERYRMVNLQNLRGGDECERLGFDAHTYCGKYNTVELRIFRASLKKERLLAQIEFTHAAVMFCRVASWRELNEATFLKFLKSSSSLYPNLADWYGVRRRAQPCLTGKQTTCQDQPETI
jgi:hypothetical protein